MILGFQFNLKQQQVKILVWYILVSWIPTLFFDSIYFSAHYFDGKWLTTSLIITLFVLLFALATLRLKLLMLIIVPLSFLGEYIFSTLLGMYDYRMDFIPVYVPFGHAVVFASSWILSSTTQLSVFIQKQKVIFTCIYIGMFLFVLLVFKDTLSAFLSLFFFLALWRKNFNSFYLLMGFVVLYLELIGTYFGCWKWEIKQGIFTTVNPPLGAIFIYVGGDILLNRIVRKSIKYKRKYLS